MIPGFNHNIKHKGRVYHIQTEDSGPKNPHIITHLFVGGNILSSKKTTYADIVGRPEYEKTVRSMMEEQHKQMLRNLVNGVFDSMEVATAYHLDGPAPMNFTANSPATAAMAGGSAFKGLPSQLGKDAQAPSPGGEGTPQVPAPVPVLVPPAQAAAAETAAPPEAAAAEARKLPPGGLFGQELISEKSLDEVILSYLAEDLAEKD